MDDLRGGEKTKLMAMKILKGRQLFSIQDLVFFKRELQDDF